MGSTKKHKKDRDSSSKRHKNRSRSRSPREQDSPDRDRERDRTERRQKKQKRRERSRSAERKRDYHSDSSDVVEVPLDLPIEKQPPTKPPRNTSSSTTASSDVPKCPPPPRLVRSPSPIPEGGLGDSLSIDETNKLRAKLGLKPLAVEATVTKKKPTTGQLDKDTSDISEDETKIITDDLGEFYHKPAQNITELKNAEKIREKIKERREKRKLEESLKKTKPLGADASDSEDDVNSWVERNRVKAQMKRDAEKRAKLLEEMDEEFGVSALIEEKKSRSGRRDKGGAGGRPTSSRSTTEYKYSNLKGLKVEHDMSEFAEGKTVILTLKDADVLDDEAKDTLVNVNIVDTERYRKNVENKKKNKPGVSSYGYECYEDEEELMEDGMIASKRSVLKKYDDEIGGAGGAKKSSFVIGSTVDAVEEQRRRMMEIKCKLENKRLVSLNEQLIRPASEYYTEEEMQAKFKKPKGNKGNKSNKEKKNRRMRTKVTADDLLPLDGVVSGGGNGDLKTSRGRHGNDDKDEVDLKAHNKGGMRKMEVKLEMDDNDDLERVLAKARRLKQKEAVGSRPVNPVEIKEEVVVKREDEEGDDGIDFLDTKIVLNETAEFCRTLGDIPTYGMAGNREQDLNDMMDLEEAEGGTTAAEDLNMDLDDNMDGGLGGGAGGGSSGIGGVMGRRGQWSSVQEEEEQANAEDDDVVFVEPASGGHSGGGRQPEAAVAENAILDEPDVGSGVAGALRLAMSKGYLEREESNKPSNSRMAYLQAKNYSIDDKAHNEDEKFNRQRDRYHTGPVSEFRDKEGYKPNVKLDYIDDNGRILNAKEAFRYLSHKFHGKGPGKNKIEKRLKKVEQEGLMMQMSSTDTPLGTLNMLQAKQKETHSPFIILSGGKQSMNSSSIGKPKMN